MLPSADTLLNRFTVKAKFRHMQVLVKLAELGSMHRAAQAVNMTQPAISQLVAELEKLLETELFFRHARGVEPTAATMELIPVARRVLSALEEGAECVANRLHNSAGVVRISSSPAALGAMILGRLDDFAVKYPEIQLHIFQDDDADPLEVVTKDAADIICTRQPSTIPSGWEFETCLTDTLVAVCGHLHPFATKGRVSSQELGDAKWLMNRVGSVARRRFEEVAAENSWPRSCRCEVIMHIPELTKEMLSTGKYLAILPRSVAKPWLKTNSFKELDTAINAPLPPLGFLWRAKTAGGATAKFASFLKSST